MKHLGTEECKDGIPKTTYIVSVAFKIYLSVTDLETDVSVSSVSYVMCMRNQKEEITIQCGKGGSENYFIQESQKFLPIRLVMCYIKISNCKEYNILTLQHS
jgi:hypothetical protein